MRNLIIIFFIMFSFQVYSQVFTRYGTTPIITKSTGNYDSSDISNPDVFYDIPNSRWVMNYSAYGTTVADVSPKWRMCLAYSNDLYTWTKEAANPVFEPITGEGYIAANGSIVYRSGTYYYFYNTGASGTLIGCYNRLATSTNLITWTRQNGGNPIGLIPTPGTFDRDGVYDPCVRILSDGYTFEAYYAAKNYSSGSPNSTGYAVSYDGISWTKKGELLPQQRWWNTSNYAEPCGARYGGGLYYSFDAAINTNLRNIAGGVTFDEGKNWSFFGFLLKSAGGTTAWDRGQVFDSYLLFYNRTWYLFYAGGINPSPNQGIQAQIGLATTPFIQQTK